MTEPYGNLDDGLWPTKHGGRLNQLVKVSQPTLNIPTFTHDKTSLPTVQHINNNKYQYQFLQLKKTTFCNTIVENIHKDTTKEKLINAYTCSLMTTSLESMIS